VPDSTHETLPITFSGRIIDHLGIQMYQSPVAALAELVANAWDADSELVEILLPDQLGDDAEIVVKDDGIGMTFEDCASRYLNVGWRRRGGNPTEQSSGKQRPILGRKGIGKFAGFGIAKKIRIETTSQQTGERTVFELNIDELRSDSYVEQNRQVRVTEYLEADESRIQQHGTTVRLRSLNLNRRISTGPFAKSMARRFLLHQGVADFTVRVDGTALPESDDLGGVEFVFPRDYTGQELPDGCVPGDDTWGEEEIRPNVLIRWRVVFYEEPIPDEELQGIAVFCNGKLAQSPFFFNLAGGIGGQIGQPYVSGQIEADYLDELDVDVIATERQRINWDYEDCSPLLEWGQRRIQELLRIWQSRRAEEKIRRLEERLSGFSARLDRLKAREGRVVKRALMQLAKIPPLSTQQFEDMGNAILTAWEQGRLRELIDDISNAEDLSEATLLEMLIEAKVLTALNVAEAVKTKVSAIQTLDKMIQDHDIEDTLRNHIADNPWLISPEWETFKVEKTVNTVLQDAAQEAELEGEDWAGRVDLALSSYEHLLVIEFMRPGLKLDWDHLSRFERYVLAIRSRVQASTAGPVSRVTGYIVADDIVRDPTNVEKIRNMRNDDMLAMDWQELLRKALSAWEEFLDALVGRVPDDERLQALVNE